MNEDTSQSMDSNERRWMPGSYVAAGFALLIFLYNLGSAIQSTTWSTDGWQVALDSAADSPEAIFVIHFLPGQTPIQAGDQLLAINGRPVAEILRAQHAFFRLTPPDWPDGTLLRYDVLRGGRPVTLEVPIRKVSYWAYFGLFREAGGSTLVQVAGSLFFFLVGVVVFLLRPGNRAAHALLFIGLGFFFNAVPANYSPPAWFHPIPPASIPFDTWTLAINPSLMYLVLAFPHPKAILQRFPRLTVLSLYLTWPIAFNVAYLLHLEDPMGYLKIAFAIYPVQVVLLMLVTLISLAHSALTTRDPVGRSQFKWMVAGIFSFVFVGVGGWLVSSYLFPETMIAGNWLLTTVGWFLLPTCLAIAITRYRLFDIDVIIRKTLVYTVLTGLLALVYFGSVLLLQTVFGRLTGEQSPIIIVVSTLLIAALFASLRGRVQTVIDRRFFRQKYDAQRVLARFAQTARDEVSLEALSAELVGVVQETIQPEKVSVWLRHVDSAGWNND